MPKSEDELTPEELPEIGLHEGDRPISTDAYLDEDPICRFDGEETLIPPQVKMPAGIFIERYIKALIVLDNESEEGEKVVKWKAGDAIPEDVTAVILNGKAIENAQKRYNGRAFLLKEANESGWWTLEEWQKAKGTDGLTLIAHARFNWLTKGGGVTTPGQQVTGTHQRGQPRTLKDKIIKKLGKW